MDSSKKDEKQLVWRRILVVPNYLVQELSDNRPSLLLMDKVDSDDLRIAIILSSGVPIILAGDQRIVITPSGDLAIETLFSVRVG